MWGGREACRQTRDRKFWRPNLLALGVFFGSHGLCPCTRQFVSECFSALHTYEIFNKVSAAYATAVFPPFCFSFLFFFFLRVHFCFYFLFFLFASGLLLFVRRPAWQFFCAVSTVVGESAERVLHGCSFVDYFNLFVGSAWILYLCLDFKNQIYTSKFFKLYFSNVSTISL